MSMEWSAQQPGRSAVKFLRDKEKDDVEEETVFNTIIGLGSSLRGTLMVEGTLRVDGDFDGDLLNCDRLEVGPHGCVRVDVQVREAIVEGQMHGSIQAEDRVARHPKCPVQRGPSGTSSPPPTTCPAPGNRRR